MLVTGFGPFPTAPHNPTAALVAALARIRRPILADVAIVPHVFRTSYAAVDRALPQLLERHRPDVLLMFGLAARTRHVRIETRAGAGRSRLISDADGAGPPHACASARTRPAALLARVALAPLLRAARMTGVDARLSRDAGRYLCNHLYRRALEAPQARHAAVVFIHVPQVARAAMARRRRGVKRAVTAADLMRLAATLLPVLAAQARRR